MADLPRLPGIPSISPVKDPTVAAILRPMKESLEILGGAISGNPLPNGSTVDAGFNPAISNVTTITSGYNGTTDTTPPPTPSGLTISAGFTNILLSWTDPNVSGTFLNYAYTEVWRSVDNVLAHAVLQGFAPGAVYSDPVGTSKSYYYWIRFVSQANVAGPYNSSTGTLGGTGLVGGVDLGPLIIDATKLATDAVESGKIKDYAITTTKIANLAVGNAAIANAAITNAKIQDLAVDDAKISSLAVNKLTAGSINVGQYIQSTGYSAGTTGWYIGGIGFAEFGAASIRGQLTASQIDTRGLTIKDSSGNVIFAAGTPLNYSYITADPGWLNSALTPTINGKLTKSGDTISGRVNFSVPDGMFAGSDVNNGVYFGSGGLFGKKAGVTTFYVDTAGNALFGGTLSAATGTFTGTLTVGSVPAVSGTSMSGYGAVFNSSGTFALGNSTTNLSFDGTNLTLNGNIVRTGNILSGAITNTVSSYTAGRVYSSGTSSWTTVQSLTISCSGGSVFVSSSGRAFNGLWVAESGDTASWPLFRIVANGSELIQSDVPSMSFSVGTASGSFTVELQILDQNTGSGTFAYSSSVSNRSLYASEFKR